MKSLHYRIAWLSGVAVLVAGCSSAQSGDVMPVGFASQAAATQKAVRPARSLPHDVLYVAGGFKLPGWVTIYPQRGANQAKIGAVTNGVDGPWSLAVDASENLYVGNADNSTVTVYARGGKTPFETLTGAGDPVGVAVARDGTVFVANYGAGNPPSDASILVYKEGQTTPSQTIPIADGSYPFGLAVDSSGDLFATINRYVAR
ncbi:MAG TPA: hypothetical protein VGI19_02900, partial [Candidatus Cybelea sp.]